MVLYEGRGREDATAVEPIAGQSSEPEDAETMFRQAGGDFWSRLFVCYTRLLRQRFWQARIDYHAHVLSNLVVMLRLESGGAAGDIESAIGEERLAQLNACAPGNDNDDLFRALFTAAGLGASVSSALQRAHGWSWSADLAARFQTLLAPGHSAGGPLPELVVKPIGFVENSVQELLSPQQIKSVLSRIRIDPRLSAGLEGLTGNQRLLVVFQFHRLAGFELHQHPQNNPALPKRGVFALHSPRRPNPIGVTEVELLRRDGNVLYVRGLDAVDGTPVLDLKLNK